MLLLSDDKPLSASAYSPVFEVLSKPAVTLSESDLISSEMLLLSDDKPLSASAYSPVFEVLSKPAATLSESDLISAERLSLSADKPLSASAYSPDFDDAAKPSATLSPRFLISDEIEAFADFNISYCLFLSEIPFSIRLAIRRLSSKESLPLSAIALCIASDFSATEAEILSDSSTDCADNFSKKDEFSFSSFSMLSLSAANLSDVSSLKEVCSSANIRSISRHCFICSELLLQTAVNSFMLFSRTSSISQSCTKCMFSVCRISLLSFIVLLRDIGNSFPKNSASLSDNLLIISRSSREHCCCSTFSQAVLFLLQYPCTARSLYAYMP